MKIHIWKFFVYGRVILSIFTDSGFTFLIFVLYKNSKGSFIAN